MRYIYHPEGDETVMHIQLHNQLGEPQPNSICGVNFHRPHATINLTLGQPVCPECQSTARAYLR